MSGVSHQEAPLGAFFRGLLLDAVPALSVLFLLILTTLPLGLPSAVRLGNILPLIGICYWSLVRPLSMKSLLVFALGLVCDALLFTPLGVHGFTFVIARAVLKKQRRFLVGQGFWVLWASFILLLLGVYTVQWLLLSVLSLHMMPFVQPLFSVALCWALLPILAGLLSMLHGAIDLFDEPIL